MSLLHPAGSCFCPFSLCLCILVFAKMRLFLKKISFPDFERKCTSSSKAIPGRCNRARYIKVQLVRNAVRMPSVNIHRGWGDETGCWLIVAKRCRKVEGGRGSWRGEEWLRGRLTFPEGSFRGWLCVSLSSAPLLPLCSPLPFFSCYCPKTGSQAVPGKLLRQKPPLHQKPLNYLSLPFLLHVSHLFFVYRQ